MITPEKLEEIASSLRQQQAQGLALYNEATGALRLIEHLESLNSEKTDE